MMSLELETDDKTSYGTALIMDVFHGLKSLFVIEKNKRSITQQWIADKLELKNRSVVNRWLSGSENLTLRTISDLAWALGYRVRIVFDPLVVEDSNEPEHLSDMHLENVIWGSGVVSNTVAYAPKRESSVAAVKTFEAAL